jgi:VanZ like family
MIRQLAVEARTMVYPALAVGPALLAIAALGPAAWWLAPPRRGPRVLAVLAAVALVGAVVMTTARPGLLGQDADWSRLASACVVTDPRPASPEGRLNLLLLAPFAALAVLAFGRPLAVAAVAGLASAGIESVQAVRSVGACDSSDLVLNLTGATVAALLAWILRLLWTGLVRPPGPGYPRGVRFSAEDEQEGARCPATPAARTTT